MNNKLLAAFRALKPCVIAIDGPAASGKSTVGHELAELANFLYFDTGIMYRAVTWAVFNAKMDVQDENAVSRIAHTIKIDIEPPASGPDDGRQVTVLVDGTDVTWEIRMPQVDQQVSLVSSYPEVRQALTDQQRRIAIQYGTGTAEKAGIVMVGRDIGTVVMPTAPLKIYLDAPAAERARRRFCEQQARGKSADMNQILGDLLLRDKKDSERTLSPLRQAADAVAIDTSESPVFQVVDRIVSVVLGKRGGERGSNA